MTGRCSRGLGFSLLRGVWPALAAFCSGGSSLKRGSSMTTLSGLPWAPGTRVRMLERNACNSSSRVSVAFCLWLWLSSAASSGFICKKRSSKKGESQWLPILIWSSKRMAGLIVGADGTATASSASAIGSRCGLQSRNSLETRNRARRTCGFSTVTPSAQVCATKPKMLDAHGRAARASGGRPSSHYLASSIEGGIFGTAHDASPSQPRGRGPRYDPCQSSIGPASSGGLFGGGAYAAQAAGAPSRDDFFDRLAVAEARDAAGQRPRYQACLPASRYDLLPDGSDAFGWQREVRAGSSGGDGVDSVVHIYRSQTGLDPFF